MQPADLRAWRERLGLSQSRAAALVGVPVRTLQGLELGRSPGSPLWGPLDRLTRYVERHGPLPDGEE